MKKIYLKPGELYFGNQATEITTILGSCVAVTMRHPQSGLSSVCHAVQPTCQVSTICTRTCDGAFRYVDCTIRKMVEGFENYGIRSNALQVKLFGGATILGCPKKPTGPISVGQMNVNTAKETINIHRLKLNKANVGGHFGRKIIFDTQTGVVWMKKIQRNIVSLDTCFKNPMNSEKWSGQNSEHVL